LILCLVLKIITNNKYKKNGLHFIACLIMLICILYYFSPLLTNAVTPGGDGGRIFPYMQFVDNSDSFFPLWNPYKCGGVPTLADPERFVWAAKIIDTDSDYANLQLNILILLIIASIGLSQGLRYSESIEFLMKLKNAERRE